MTQRARRSWTLAGIVTPSLMVLGLFQQLAVTRQSFLAASGSRDMLVGVLSATQDTLEATRDSLQFVRARERACRRAKQQAATAAEMEALGPPAPPRKGGLVALIAGAAGLPAKGLRWLVGI